MCGFCQETYEATQAEINSPLGQVMFYEGVCAECAALNISAERSFDGGIVNPQAQWFAVPCKQIGVRL